MRVLLLEDDERVAMGLQRIAAGEGHAVHHVRTVAEARAALRDDEFGMFLADMGLANGENGIEALSWAAQHRPGPVRVLMTGAGTPGRGAGLPWELLYAKPFGRDELLQMIDQAAHLRAANRPPGGAEEGQNGEP